MRPSAVRKHTKAHAEKRGAWVDQDRIRVPRCLWRRSLYAPVTVPLAVLVIRHGVQVGQGDDVSAVGAEPLLTEAAFPLFQLALVLVGHPHVGVQAVHLHACHRRVVAPQELAVDTLIALRTKPQALSIAVATRRESQLMQLLAITGRV